MRHRLRGNADTILKMHADHQQVLLYILIGIRSLVHNDGKHYADRIMRIGELSHKLYEFHENRDINDPFVTVRLDVTQLVKELFEVIGWTPDVVLEVYHLPEDPDSVDASFKALAVKTGLKLQYVQISEENEPNEW